jgi:uncharacterized membrane protein YcjF (UPF0283 family)
MTESTKELDRLIRDALRADDAEVLDQFEDQSALELLTESFRGRRRLSAIAGVAANLLLIAAAVVAAVRFLESSDQRTMLIWAGAVAFCVLAITAIKIWWWIEMARLGIARDLRRVELQVALLSQRLGGRGA